VVEGCKMLANVDVEERFGMQECDCKMVPGCIVAAAAVDDDDDGNDAAVVLVDIEPGVELDSRKESVRRKVLVRTVELGCEKGSEGQCRTTIVDKCIAPDGRWFRTTRAEWERKVSSLPGGRTIGLHTAAGNCSFL